MVMVLCLAVAMLSSMPWLIKPELQPGSLAPFDAVAPKDAVVQDSTVLEQRRSSLVARSVVQVIDPESHETTESASEAAAATDQATHRERICRKDRPCESEPGREAVA